MRLLSTETLEFEEFHSPPPYAILSHRWRDHEISLDEYRANGDQSGPGYDKIRKGCALAASRGHRYFWIDTCCIDKRSSAELSEAINSMWTWYAKATECFAYLFDVQSIKVDGRQPVLGRLYKSERFKRGWTLQELLAPRVVTFCDIDWNVIGQKTDPDLLKAIRLATSVPESCLISQINLMNRPVAQKLSWASSRRTSRPEDIAYCLLGLVGVNMPLLYGEGDKAFLRLQQEIIRQSDDESIFAWRYVSPPKGLLLGILATHISLFSSSGTVGVSEDIVRQPYEITNKGLRIHAKPIQTSHLHSNVFLVPLNCYSTYASPYGTNVSQPCSIVVKHEDGAFYRTGSSRLGGHAMTMYNGRSVEPQLIIIQLTRWQHEYQPAIVAIKKLMQRRRGYRDAQIVERKRETAAIEASLEKKPPCF